MKTTHENPTRTCSLCHRTLPADHFYRRQQNYLHQHPDEALAPTEKAPARPNIFTETDPQRRMQLILQACKVVRESVRRKQQQLREEGLDDEP